MVPTSTRFGRLPILVLLAATLAACPVLLAVRPTDASSTFTVNLTGDGADVNLADNLCDVIAGGAAQCTLRAAIQQANATAGADVIEFDIPGDGVKVIRPLSPLPEVTRRVTVDGYSQPGAKRNTLATGTNAVVRIELDGSRTSSGSGLVVRGANSVVQGLAIGGFDNSSGVIISGADATGVRVQGCFLGTDAAGTAARPNFHGVLVADAIAALVGGATPAARNLISGNDAVGVFLLRATAATVQGNLIGTRKSGAAGLGNGSNGVLVNESSQTTIGGATAAAANTIAFNESDGVFVAGASSGNEVARNSIFANGLLGIDLEPFGPTANDRNDTDGGANSGQNKPLIETAATAGGSTVVQGRLNSLPNRVYVIRLYANPSGDEGRSFVGQASVRTNETGRATFEFAPVPAIPEGHTVTATATNPDDETSEFSPAVKVA